MKHIIAYDLGTGGIKASLFDSNGKSLASAFVEYDTFYPSAGLQEQKPSDWWNGVITSTEELLQKTSVDSNSIVGIGLSGHSLGVVAVDSEGELLSQKTPIWSDARALEQAKAFLNRVDEKEWYETTGNGFPAHLYSVFKIMWYRDNEKGLYDQTYKFIGTKDYINLCLTGEIITDHSYASGSGVYNLDNADYETKYIDAAGISAEKLPEIVPSTQIIGTLTQKAAQILGLSTETKVVCGGVDNACMALGASCFSEGKAYTSLGTSAWIGVSSEKPVIDYEKKPYVFAHCVPGQYVSATCIFSAGRSFKWVKDTFCKNIEEQAKLTSDDVYSLMTKLAEKSPVGANKLIFNPSLAGGSSIDSSVNLKGSYVGIDLMHTQADIIRATLEGISINLRLALDVLKIFTDISEDMLIVGGGGKSKLWRQIFADIYDMKIIETKVGQDAGSLGAAALAAVGTGLWSDFSTVSKAHELVNEATPVSENKVKYEKIIPIFKEIAEFHSKIGDNLTAIEL